MAKVRFLDAAPDQTARASPRVRYLDPLPAAPAVGSQPSRGRVPSVTNPLDRRLSGVPTGHRTDAAAAFRAEQGNLPVNVRGRLSEPRQPSFEPIRRQPDRELMAALDAVDAGMAPDLSMGPTANRAVLDEYTAADPIRRQAIRAELMQAPPPPSMSRGMSALGSFVQGAGDVLAGVPKSISIANANLVQATARGFDYIDQNGAPEFPGDRIAPTPINRYWRASPEERQRMRVEAGLAGDPRQGALYQAGESLQEAVRGAVPSDPAYRGEFFAEALPRGVGSTIGFLSGGLLARRVGLPAGATTAGLGMSAEASAQFEDALNHGASIETALEAAKLALPAGASEALPISRMLDRLDRATGGQIKRALIEAVKGGVEEGAQELLQTVMGNAVAQGLYDPQRGWLDSTGQPGAVGFTTGALFNFLTSILPGKSRTGAGDQGAAGAEIDPFAGISGMVRPNVETAGGRVEPFLGLPSGTDGFPASPPFGTTPGAPASQAAPQAAGGALPIPANKPDLLSFGGPARRQIVAGGVQVPTIFPDAAHAALYDYALALERSKSGSLENLGALAAPLYRHFAGFVEGVRGPGDINELAQDYAADIRDVGPSAVTARGESEYRADPVIDPDRALNYWQRSGEFPYGEGQQGGRVRFIDGPPTLEAAPASLPDAFTGNAVPGLELAPANLPDAFSPNAQPVPPPDTSTGAGSQFPAPSGSVPVPGQQSGSTGAAVPPVAPTAAPAAPPPPAPFGPGAQPGQGPGNMGGPGGNVVVTPTGRRLDVEYQVVDAGDLITSGQGGYPQELQPRDRSRAASQAQIAEIAGSIQPELLGRSSDATSGAPIIGPDRVVESGNGRIMALRQAYSQGRAEGYRRWLQSQGYDISGRVAPVLVRVRRTELSPQDRIAFTVESNQRNTLGMGAAEQATADARAMSPGLIESYRGGDLTAAGNRNFVRSFVDSIVPPSERGSIIGPGGAISQEGLRRIEAALFARAYGDARILAALREDTDSNIKAIGGALTDAAPLWVQLRQEVQAGRARPEMDITPALVEAVNAVARARREGVLLSDLVAQRDMLGGGISLEAQAVLRLMFSDDTLRRPVSRQRLASALAFYADQARRSSAGGLDLGDALPSPASLLDLARNRGTGELFGAAGVLPDVAEMRYGRVAGAGRKGALVRFLDSEASLPETALATATASGPGANYVGSVRQTYNPAVADSASGPLRREAILRDLVKALGMPIYSGRIKSAKMLGFYRKRVGEIRVKNAADIETAAHEAAHYLDDKFPELRKQWNPATNANAAIRAELSGISYDASKLYEGFAEFVRLWSTQADLAQTRAPQFYQWFEQWVDRSAYKDALRKMQRDMTAWFEQSALDRARSKIGTPPAINEALTTVGDEIRQSIFDDLHGIMEMERQMTGGLSPVGPYETARLTRAAASITEGAILYGAPTVQRDGSHRFVGKGLQQILDPVAGSLDDFLMYAVGRSANELMQQGREHLFTRAEIKAMLALEKPAFRQAFNDYQVWNSAILDFAQAKSLIDPMARAFWRRFEYLPFHRVGQPGGGSRGAQGNWSGIKALTGGTANIRDVLGNIVGNANMLISSALKNEARLSVANLARQKGGARFMAKIPTEERGVQISRSEVERAILQALGVKSKQALPIEWQNAFDQMSQGMGPLVTFIMRGQHPTGRDVVAALRQGRPEFYEVADKTLYRALTALDRKPRGWVMRVLSMPKRIGQLAITLTPDFAAANFVRDTLTGTIMSRHGFRPLYDSAKGLVSRLRSDQNYRDYIANGGGLSSHLLDETSLRTHLDRFYTGKGIDYRTVLDTPRKVWFAVEKIAESFEMATRLGEYQRAIAKGQHPRHAAYSAREVSTDFSMRGDNTLAGIAFDLIIFLKAGANGMDRLYRGLAHDPNRGRIAALTGLLALASMALYAINRGNPLYDQLEDWDRDVNWHLFVPRPGIQERLARGENVPMGERYWHFRIPKIWEIGAVSSVAERQLEGLLNGQTWEAQKHTARVIVDLFKMEYLPQFAAPAVETFWMNRDRFTGRQIETMAMQELQPWARSSEYTSPTVRTIGEATRNLPVQISPAQLEHLLEGYFGTWAMYGLMTADGMFFDDRPDLRLDQYPVLRRFYREEPARSTRYMSELYDAIEAATEARRTLRSMARDARPDIFAEMENDPDNLLYPMMTQVDKALRNFRKQMERVYGMSDLAALQEYATNLAHGARDETMIGKAKMAKAWDDLGALKLFVINEIVSRRNAYAERAMGVADAKRQEMSGAGRARLDALTVAPASAAN